MRLANRISGGQLDPKSRRINGDLFKSSVPRRLEDLLNGKAEDNPSADETGDALLYVPIRICQDLTVCRVGQATAPAHLLCDVVGRRSAGPTVRIRKRACCVMNPPDQSPLSSTESVTEWLGMLKAGDDAVG